MQITITNEKENYTKTIETNANTVKDLLSELGVNSETVIVACNDEILLLSDTLENGQDIKLLSVISGG